MNSYERLAIATAFKKAAEEVCGKDSQLRQEVDNEVIIDYHDRGIKSRDLRVAGKKVGTLSVSVSNEKAVTEVKVVDSMEFDQWMRDNVDLLIEYIQADRDKFAEYVFKTGELADGCDVKTAIRPEYVKYTRVSVNPEQVADALKGQLPEAVNGLLGGGR